MLRQHSSTPRPSSTRLGHQRDSILGETTPGHQPSAISISREEFASQSSTSQVATSPDADGYIGQYTTSPREQAITASSSQSIRSGIDESVLRDLKMHDALLERQLDDLLEDMEIYGAIHSDLAEMLKLAFHFTEYEVQIVQSLGLVSVQSFYSMAAKSALKLIASYPDNDIQHPKVIKVLARSYCVGLLIRRLTTHMSTVKSDEATSRNFCSVITEEMATDVLKKQYRGVRAIMQRYVKSLGTNGSDSSLVGSTLHVPHIPSSAQSIVSDVSRHSNRSWSSKVSSHSHKISKLYTTDQLYSTSSITSHISPQANMIMGGKSLHVPEKEV